MEKTKQNELTDEEKDVLKKHHEAKKKALLAELSQIDSKLEIYGGSTRNKAQTKLTFAGFPKNASIPEQTLFVVKDLNKVSSVAEIIDRFAEYDPTVKEDGKNVPQKYRHIYSALLYKVKIGQAFKVLGSNPVLFGLKDWLAKDGGIKDDYLIKD